MQRRPLLWIVLAAAVAIGLLWPSAARAQNDRIIDTPTGWSYLFGADSTTIALQQLAGNRPFSIAYAGNNTYDVVFVSNSGAYQVNGAEVVYNRTPQQMIDYLSANNRRLLDLEVFDASGQTRMTAITLPNSGATGTPAWGWLYNTSFSAIATWMSQNPSLRLIDLDVYRIGGTQYYSAVAVHNSGSNAQGWWFYNNVTGVEIASLLQQNNARLITVEMVTPGSGILNPARFACVMVSSNPGGGWFYSVLTSPSEIAELLAQNGARLTCLHRYTTSTGATRWAVAMVDNVNAQTRRVRDYMSPQHPAARYGFRLKEVGGSVIAALNDSFVFEPASTMKIVHGAYAIRQCSLGADSLTSDVFVLDRCNPNECPDNTGCNSGNESLGEVIRRTLQNSDNNRTWELENRYGRTTLNNWVSGLGMSNTRINHRLGCLCGNPFNTMTAVDATNIYERIANGNLFNATWRDELFSRMNNLNAGVGWGNYSTLSAIINQEAASTNLTGTEINQFRNLVRFAHKAGGYGCDGLLWRSVAGWASIPFKQQVGGSWVTVNRQYVMATFVHRGLDPASEICYPAKEEILREQVRAALQSWDAACAPSTITSHPGNRTVNAGGSTTFTAGVNVGAGTPTYRWQRRNIGSVNWTNLSDGARISGALTASMTISNIMTSDEADYRLSVAKDCGTVFSNAARLTVNVPSCPADWNNDGVVNSNDISAYLTAWLNSVQQGNLIADFNGDGQVNSNDISAFLTAWLSAVQGGC